MLRKQIAAERRKLTPFNIPVKSITDALNQFFSSDQAKKFNNPNTSISEIISQYATGYHAKCNQCGSIEIDYNIFIKF